MKIQKFIITSFAILSLHSLDLNGVTNLTVNTANDTNPTGGGSGSGTSGDLRYVLNYININGPDTFNVTFNTSPTITLQGMLPIINLNATNTVNIDGTNSGNQITIDGASTYPGLIVRQGTVNLQTLGIANTISQGGDGGGGALGAGGGLFLIGGTTTLSNLTFTNNAASGGTNTCGSGIPGGGGGMFRGNSTTSSGGGGMGAIGGIFNLANGEGGGGIGLALNVPAASNTVGRGGAFALSGNTGAGLGAAAGGSSFGAGGFFAGGGGGGAIGTTQGPAGGGISGSSVSAGNASGGNGGFGGGGGGFISVATATSSGNGGFGGGGGGNGLSVAGSTCGNGGFGGGGGQTGSGTSTVGNGGFGAGGGFGGTAGVGGGTGGVSGSSNGGAGLGGAIFVNRSTTSTYYNSGAGGGGGAELVIAGPITIVGSSVTGGGSGAGLGAAVGRDIFTTSGTGPSGSSDAITFDTTSGDFTYSNTIADDSSYSLPGGTYQAGSAYGGIVVKKGSGTLTLGGTNRYSGGTEINGGTVQALVSQAFGNPSSNITFTGTGTLTIQAGANITVANPIITNNGSNTFDTNGFNMGLSGIISGSGALNKNGLGQLLLTAVNTYSGGTNVNTGTLSLSGSGSLLNTGAVNVSSGTTFDISGVTTNLTIGDLTGTGNVTLGSKELIFGTSNSITTATLISGGSGKLTKQGTGTVILSNTNTYTGLTTINNGILQITTGTLDPTGGILISSPGQLTINQTTLGTYSGNINGTGSLVVSGGPGCEVNLTGNNTYSGGTTVQSNCVLFGNTSAIQGNIANSGIVDFEAPGTYAGVISGGGITEINGFGGSGTITFTGIQTYTLRTAIANGTLALTGSGDISSAKELQIGSSATFDISGVGIGTSTVGDLIGSGTINLGTKTLVAGTATTTATYGGVIQGTGGLTKQGSGTLILTGISTYSGTTNINAGTLQITPATLPNSAIVNNGILDFEQSSGSAIYPGAISGSGAVSIGNAGGTGTVIFTGNNTYTGLTTLSSGNLTLQYGAANSFTGPFFIGASKTLNFDQAAATTGTYSGNIDGSGNVAINQTGGYTGTVILSGLRNYTGSTTVYAGTLELLSTTTSTFPSPITAVSGATLDLEQGVGTIGTYSGGILGGGNLQVNQAGNVGTVVITGTSTYTGTTTVFNGTLEFLNTATGTNTSAITVNAAGTVDFEQSTGTIGTFSGGLSGSGTVYVNLAGSTGTVYLTGPNTFTGLTTVYTGTLAGTPSSLPNTQPITVNNGALVDIEQASGSGTYAGTINGAGGVLIGNLGGSGTVILTGNNTYTGLTNLVGGNLSLQQTSSYSFGGDFLVNASKTLDFDQSAATTGTYNGAISGSGNVAINQLGGTGLIILSGTRSYTGTTTVYGGTLELSSNVTSTYTTPITLQGGSTLDIEQSTGTTGTYAGGITGAGNLQINQTGNLGTVVLSGTNNYTGTTTVFNGLLNIQGITTATIPTAITVNSLATLNLEQAGSTVGTYSGGLSGSGTFTVNSDGSTGTVYLTGLNAFTGTTTVFSGTLAGTPTTLPSSQPIKVNTDATVDIEQILGTGTFTGSIQDNGASQHGIVSINKLGATGTVILSGANSYTGGTKVYNGTLQGTVASLVGNIAVSTNATVDIEQASGTGIFTGTITDNGLGQAGGVTINKQGGTGTVAYTNVNTYSGGTTVYNGKLLIQPTFLTGDINVKTGASLDIELPSSTETFGGNISGGGAVVINSVVGNVGTIILSGNNTYTGGTIVSGGTLQGDTKSLFGTITDNATVHFIQSTNGTFNGSFQGNGIIKISGDGLVKFETASSSFTGTTNIDDGRLRLNTSLGGDVFVKAFSILSGNGTILGNLTIENNGTVRPGNSIGTITVNGNYTQQGGSIYDVQVNGTGQNSLILVGGQATLNPGSDLLVTTNHETPAINTRYTILTANGGVNGTYSNVFIFDNSSLIPVVTYDANNVYLNIKIDFSEIAKTYNQQQVANELSTIDATNSPALNEMLQQLAGLSTEDARRALSQMSAEQYTNVILIGELANRQFIRRLFDPIRTILTTNPCKPVVCCNYIQHFDTWFSISGGRSFIHGNENARGFRIADYEVAAGAQTTIGRCWTFGVALSYERDTIKYKVGGSGKCNTVLSGIYSLYRGKRFYALFDGIIGYSNDKVSRTIDVGTLHYKPHGTSKLYQGAIYAELGSDFAIDNSLIQPFVALEWGHYRYNSFRESGGYPLAVNIRNKSQSNAYSWLGVHLTSPPLRCGFSMNIDLAWQYRLTPLSNNINVAFQQFGTPFNIRGLPLNRNSYEGTVRFSQLLCRNWELFFEGTCQGWSNSTSYSFVGGFKTTW